MLPRLITRWPTATAASIYLTAVLLAFSKFFTGQVLLPPHSDQLGGYPPRLLAAEFLREHGRLPEWSPYIFGGFPFVANTGFGDTLFPTALLRMVMPVDAGMALGLMLFVFLAGLFAFIFFRGLGLSWGAAFVGGAAFLFSGMVVSMVSPGHDGKLYVTALLPLALHFLHHATARRDWRYYLYFGVTVGFCLLSPHVQATYYLLMASGFFWFFMVFLSKERSESEPWWRATLLFAGALGVGFLVAAVQLLPFLEYVPYSARGAADRASATWENAISYSMPPEEVIGNFLPFFNGAGIDYTAGIANYIGRNPFRLHSDYMGLTVGLLALGAIGFSERRRYFWFFVFLAAYSALFAFGGHTPFYAIPYYVLPGIAKTRAPSIIYFVASFSIAALAAIGTEKLLRSGEGTGSGKGKGGFNWELPDRRLLIGFAVVSALGLLAAAGGLRPVMESIAGLQPILAYAPPDRSAVVETNYPLFVRQFWFALILAAALVAVLIATQRRKLALEAGALLVGGLVLLDLWSVERKSIYFSPPASEQLAADDVVTALKSDTTLFRVLPLFSSTYDSNYLMVHRIRSALGYNSFELHAYDELLGGKGSWASPQPGSNVMNPNLWSLLGVKYVILDAPLPPADSVPEQIRRFVESLSLVGDGLRSFEGDVETALYRVTNPLPFAYLVRTAWRVEAERDVVINTLMRPDFRPDGMLLLPPDSPVGEDAADTFSLPIENRVLSVEEYPGKFTFTFERPVEADAFLYVGENWYPGWTATVDGAEAPVVQAQVSLMAVPVAAGATTVQMEFRSSSFRLGRMISLVTLLSTAAIAALAWWRRRQGAA